MEEILRKLNEEFAELCSEGEYSYASELQFIIDTIKLHPEQAVYMLAGNN